MTEPARTYKELIEEISLLKQRVVDLEQSESEQKRAQEIMSDTETRYHMLFDHSPDGIVIINPFNAQLLEFNETAHRQLGYTRKEFARLSISDFEMDETSEETKAHIAKVIREGRSDFNTRHRTKLGEIKNIHVTAQVTKISGKTLYHCIWRDITEQKRTEEALRESEAQLRVLSENLAEGMVYQIDSGQDGQKRSFSYLSPAIERLHGHNVEEVKRNPSLIYDQVIGEYRAAIADAEANAYASGSKLEIDLPIRLPSGEVRWRRFISSPHTDSDGSIIWDGIELDITERKRMEEEAAVLVEIGRVFASTLDINKVYDQFVNEVRKLIRFDRIHLNLRDPDGEAFTIACVSGVDIAGRREGDKVPIAGSISEVLCRTRAGLCLHPVSEEVIIGSFPSASAVVSYRAGMRSIMAVPLVYGDEVIGILHFRSKKPNAYSEQDLRLAEKIGMQIAGAVANAQLYADIKMTEKFFRESENKFRTLVNNAAVGITEVEAMTGRFVAVNPMFCEILGRTEEELLGATFMEITHPDDLNQHPNLSKRMYGGELDHYTLEKRYIKKDGRVIWVNVTISRLWKAGEALGRSITVVHDITERKQAEEALKETLDQLESRVRERTIELEETNIAMQVLLKKGDKDQQRVEDSLQSNINQLVTPFLIRLRKSQTNEERQTYLNVLETNLSNITSPFINRLSAAYKNLTPKEIQIAELIKQGKRSKEIAELFHLSVGTVITHRNNIRKKLHLRSSDTNLRSYLLSLV